MTAGPVIELDAATKRYGKREVLSDVGLAAAVGESIALVGHNGAGKTTLIKLLLGLTRLSSGRIRVMGADPGKHGFAQTRREIGFLPENVAFYETMTGRELLRLYAGLQGSDADQTGELLARLGLAPAADRRIRTYSKGMRQRLGLAQALLGAPRLLLLDEPTNGLDPPLRRLFFALVGERQAAGAATLIASHALTEIESRVDRIAILRAGRLVAFGSLDELRSASGLPLRVCLTVKPEAAGRIAEEIGGGVRIVSAEAGRMELACPTAEKVSMVKKVGRLDGVLKDVAFEPPGLDDIYAHYVGEEAPQ